MIDIDSQQSDAPNLRVLLAEAEAKLKDRIEKGRKFLKRELGSLSSYNQAIKDFVSWQIQNKCELGILFENARKLEAIYNIYTTDIPNIFEISTLFLVTSNHNYNRDFKGRVWKAIQSLERIAEDLPLYVRQSDNQFEIAAKYLDNKNRDIFIVHGRDNELKEMVARFLEKLELSPIVLHEQASAGRTIIEKFEDHAYARFAIILLTPDDVGCLAPPASVQSLSPRARQNVVFEWGYFVAKLGRKNVCALTARGLEKPSDMDGILCIPANESSEWKLRLAQEMRAVGIEVDLNKAYI